MPRTAIERSRHSPSSDRVTLICATFLGNARWLHAASTTGLVHPARANLPGAVGTECRPRLSLKLDHARAWPRSLSAADVIG